MGRIVIGRSFLHIPMPAAGRLPVGHGSRRSCGRAQSPLAVGRRRTNMTIWDGLIWGEPPLTLAGLVALAWCIVSVARAKARKP